MLLKKSAASLFFISAFSVVYLACTNPGAVEPGKVFTATLTGANEVPANNTTANGTATLTLSGDEKTATVTYAVSNLSGNQTGAHIHGPAKPGENADVVFELTGPSTVFPLSDSQRVSLKSGLYYVNVHTDLFPSGQIRGQLTTVKTNQ
jgi:hypothetical protein